ncbi:MAG: sugar transferase [Bacteroides sp.]|nr:sugar transferase [Bacteroides sp.]
MKRRIAYVVADYLSTIVGVMVFTVVRFAFIPDLRERFSGLWRFFFTPGLKLTMALFPLFMLGIYYLSGYYANVRVKSRMTEFLSTGACVAVGSVCFFMVVLLNDVLPRRVLNYEILLVFFGCLFVPVYLTRFCLTTYYISCRRREGMERVAVITDEATDVGEIASAIRRSGMELGGVVRLPAGMERGDGDGDEPFPDRLRRQLGGLEADSFAVALTSERASLFLGVLGGLYPLDRPIYVKPDDYTMLVSKVTYDNLLSEPLMDVSRSPLPDSLMSMKRAADVCCALAGLLIVSPVIAVLGVMVKAGSEGPVFYSQERVGYHRKPFRIYKLRTMTVDAEKDGPALSADDDPRVTPVGRFMRKYRLDELPNLWNVLRGDMSLVGPRPEREYYLSQLRERAPYSALLHQVRPGLTSLGMVKFGYASSIDDMLLRLKYDLLYIQNISLSLDLKVVFYTVRTILRGEGK